MSSIILADPPKAQQRSGHEQQAKTASNAPLSVQQPSGGHSLTGRGCPGTHETRFDCNSVSAIANVRQADAAEWFNHVAVAEIGVGVFTAFVAALAARWAKQAAEAGIKSYKAFVAAEDAHLVLDLEDGPRGSTTTADGVTIDYYTFRMTLSNVGRSAARLHQLFVETDEGSLARPIASTLKPDAEMSIRDDLYMNANNGKATVSFVYSTSLHPESRMDFIVALDVKYPRRKADAYVERTRIGRPKAK